MEEHFLNSNINIIFKIKSSRIQTKTTTTLLGNDNLLNRNVNSKVLWIYLNV